MLPRGLKMHFTHLRVGPPLRRALQGWSRVGEISVKAQNQVQPEQATAMIDCKTGGYKVRAATF